MKQETEPDTTSQNKEEPWVDIEGNWAAEEHGMPTAEEKDRLGPGHEKSEYLKTKFVDCRKLMHKIFLVIKYI